MKNRDSQMGDSWSIGTQFGRWAGFGPYYAMFPVGFARDAIARYSDVGDTVVDPFCGRGTTNYVAQALSRDSVGYELNPVGWIYATTKTNPARRWKHVARRVEELFDLRDESDSEPENEFQSWAYCSEALAFINSCRRNLKWRTSKIDRTVAAFVLVYLHGKAGDSLSNQMRQSKSMSPNYAVRWWKDKGLSPPKIDPVQYLNNRIEWRYKKGLWQADKTASIILGDCTKMLPGYAGRQAKLVLTSPPYSGVTNYKYDNWIRLWALGGQAFPSWTQEQRYANKVKYLTLIQETFGELRKRSREDAVIVVRTDFREFTLRNTAQAIHSNWPDHQFFARRTNASKPTQTALFGDHSAKPGEVDLIALPQSKLPPEGFKDLLKE